MRKLVVVLMMILMGTSSAFADENSRTMEILEKIEAANSSVKTIQGRFVHGRISRDGTHEALQGMLYVGSGNMAMHYDKSDQEIFMIQDDRIHMRRKGKARDINLKIIRPMQSLKTTLLYSMQGKVASLAKFQPSYAVTAVENGGDIVIEFRSMKKGKMGYEVIRNTYDARSHLIKRMEMVEFNGNSNIYTISSLSVDKHIPQKMFDIDLYK